MDQRAGSLESTLNKDMGTKRCSSFQFSVVFALRKAPVRSALFLRRLPSVVFETVSMLVWLTMSLSGPFKVHR